MSLQAKLEAQEVVTQSVTRYFTIQKAVSLNKRNIASGIGTLDPELQQVFYVAFLNLRMELEDVIDTYIAGSNLVGPIISAKILDIYTKCLRCIRAYSTTESNSIYNRVKYVQEYEQPKIVSEEIATLSLLSDEFLEDLSSDSQSLQEEVETFS